MNITYTQSIAAAKTYPCAEIVEIVTRRIRAEMTNITACRAVSTPGGYVIPVVRHSLNPRAGLSLREYIA